MNDVSDRPSWSQLNQRGGWGSGDAAKPASFQLPQPRRSGQQCRTPRANKKQSVLTPPLTSPQPRNVRACNRTGQEAAQLLVLRVSFPPRGGSEGTFTPRPEEKQDLN